MGKYEDEYFERSMDSLWEVAQPSPDDPNTKLFVGAIIDRLDKTFEGDGVKINTGRISKALQDGGAITKLDAGGGGKPSVFILERRHYGTHDDGEAVDFGNVKPGHQPSKAEVRDAQYDKLVAMVARHESEIGALKAWIFEHVQEHATPKRVDDVMQAFDEEREQTIAEKLGLNQNDTDPHS
jgi:hypothetical protein